MKRVDKITIEFLPDETESYPDHLGKFASQPEGEFTIDRSEERDYQRGEYKYFNAENVENMKQARENYERAMQFERGHVSVMGIRAKAQIATSSDARTWTTNYITSPGLWGIDSDSGNDYLQSVALEEIVELQHILRHLDFLDETIQQAEIVSKHIDLPADPFGAILNTFS